jgi:magnesium transporter
MTDPLFSPEIRMMMESNDAAGLKALCEALHPATVADALDDLPVEDVWKVLQHTDIKTQAAIFEYFPLERQVEMVQGTGRAHMARLIEQMSHDDRADLLRRLNPRVADELLRLVDEADRRDIAMLTRYGENTAGALMTTDYAWLPANITVAEALDRLRLQAPDRETIYYVYVLDEHRKLLGVISLRDLILAPRHALIRDRMETELVSVHAQDDREIVAQQLARYDLLAIPVVDDEGRLVGIVTHDDVIDVVVEEATEDVQRLGGVGTIPENYLEANILTVWRKRAVWLACLFGAELFTFTALATYEDAIKAVVVLSLFVPLCISTGGNSGSQAATLITRAMALNQVTHRQWLRVLRHELILGIMLGVTLGAIGFVRAALTPTSVLSNTEEMREGFALRVPEGSPLRFDATGKAFLPQETEITHRIASATWVTLPDSYPAPEPRPDPVAKQLVYDFPPHTQVGSQAVSRWILALVVALSVAAICLWGTLVGSMLPLIFRSLGFDPAFASSPFVATFVDVTGIVIYFTIATMLIPGLG